jgi:hypothetical protein
MSGFIEGEDRTQATLFPERIDDYIAEDNAVRVIDVFINELDLSGLGFKTVPEATGRPAYLRLVCRQFVMLCRKLNLFADAFVAIDGSKFKAVNNVNRNYTRAKVKQRLALLDKSIEQYLGDIASADRQESKAGTDKTERLEGRITKLREEMQALKKLEVRLLATPDQQLSLTDPDARAMGTTARGRGVVGYNVQTAVDARHHLIVAHEVTNIGHDRTQLANMAQQAKAAINTQELAAVADRGYFSGEEIRACEQNGITTYLPKPQTSGNQAKGLYGKRDFIYKAEDDEYECPAGERLVSIGG